MIENVEYFTSEGFCVYGYVYVKTDGITYDACLKLVIEGHTGVTRVSDHIGGIGSLKSVGNWLRFMPRCGLEETLETLDDALMVLASRF